MMETVRLLDVCKAYQPKTIAVKALSNEGRYPVYGANGIIGQHTDYNHSEEEVLMGCRGSCGAVHISQPYSWINGNAMVIQPNGNYPILKKYLYYCLLAARKDSIITGTAQPQITRRSLCNFKIQVCTPEQQQRIVAKIEELFSELDNSVADLKQTKAQLSVYRQAVLKDAFKDFKNWPAHTLGSLMEEVRNGYGLKPTGTGQHKILTIGSVREGKLNLEEHRLNDSSFEKKDTIDTNDLLFTRYNGNRNYVGICAIVPELNETFAYPDKLIKFVPRIKSVNHSKFLQYYVHQGEARKYIRSKIKTTSGQNGISGSDLKKTIIHLPSESVQVQIVEYIEAKLTLCDDIEKQIDKTLQQAESLRQSILKQAFEGKLV